MWVLSELYFFFCSTNGNWPFWNNSETTSPSSDWRTSTACKFKILWFFSKKRCYIFNFILMKEDAVFFTINSECCICLSLLPCSVFALILWKVMGIAVFKDSGQHQLGKNCITFYCKVITAQCSGTYLQRHPPVLRYCRVLSGCLLRFLLPNGWRENIASSNRTSFSLDNKASFYLTKVSS